MRARTAFLVVAALLAVFTFTPSLQAAPLPFFLNLPGSKAFIRLQATPGAP